ncbi:hypothetical protein Tco_0504858 [Tanacetum coccineum]
MTLLSPFHCPCVSYGFQIAQNVVCSLAKRYRQYQIVPTPHVPMASSVKTLYPRDIALLDHLIVSTLLFLVFEEVLRLLLVGSLSSLEADSDGGVIGLAISLLCIYSCMRYWLEVKI